MTRKHKVKRGVVPLEPQVPNQAVLITQAPFGTYPRPTKWQDDDQTIAGNDSQAVIWGHV